MTNSIILITSGDVSAFAKEVDQCIAAAVTPGGLNLAKFAEELARAAQRLSTSRMQSKSIASCGVTYCAGDMEYDEWAMALLLMARSAESLRRKARDGHCYSHGKPCKIAQPTELQVWNDCLQSFEELLAEMKTRGPNDSN